MVEGDEGWRMRRVPGRRVWHRRGAGCDARLAAGWGAGWAQGRALYQQLVKTHMGARAGALEEGGLERRASRGAEQGQEGGSASATVGGRADAGMCEARGPTAAIDCDESVAESFVRK